MVFTAPIFSEVPNIQRNCVQNSAPKLPKLVTKCVNHGQKFIYSPTKSMTVPDPIFVKRMIGPQLFATTSYTQFHENPTNGLFADVR